MLEQAKASAIRKMQYPKKAENMNRERQYILASGSPRRIEMMRNHGYEPVICPADIEENMPLHSGMRETVMFLAFKKAKAVEAKYLAEHGLTDVAVSSEQEGCGRDASGEPAAPVIIAADTIVYKDEIIGKPHDKDDARRILASLAGDTHYVATGCALLEAGCEHARVFVEVTKVFVNEVDPAAIEAYINTDEPYDKAGAYAIQGTFGKYIDHIEGDYDNVVGFPWTRIEKELELL